MKRVAFILMVAAVITSTMGCKIGDEIHRFTPPCFVLSYVPLDSLSVTTAEGYCAVDTMRPFVMVTQHSSWESEIDYNYWDEGADNGWFMEKYSAKYGDTSFSEELAVVAGPEYEHGPYITPDMKGVIVTSPEDYDAAHPAGVDLGDIIRYSGVSAYPFIRNGYAAIGSVGDYKSECQADSVVLDYISWFNRYRDYPNCLTPIFKQCDELTETDLYLNGVKANQIGNVIDPFFCLTFMSLPEEKGVHEFTLTMNGDDGKVYTAEFSYDFGGAE